MKPVERERRRKESPQRAAVRERLAAGAVALCTACPLVDICNPARQATCEIIADTSGGLDTYSAPPVDYRRQLMDESVQSVFARALPVPPKRTTPPKPREPEVKIPQPIVLPPRQSPPIRTSKPRRATRGETLPEQIAGIIALALGRRAVDART